MLLGSVFVSVFFLCFFFFSLSFWSFLPFLHRRSCCFSGSGHPLTDPDRAPSRGPPSVPGSSHSDTLSKYMPRGAGCSRCTGQSPLYTHSTFGSHHGALRHSFQRSMRESEERSANEYRAAGSSHTVG